MADIRISVLGIIAVGAATVAAIMAAVGIVLIRFAIIEVMAEAGKEPVRPARVDIISTKP